MTFLENSQQYISDWERRVEAPEVAAVVSSLNHEALNLMLVSLLTGSMRPAKIIVRLEGTVLPNFYFTQLQQLAAVEGIQFIVTQAQSRGVHYARDWMLHTSLLGSSRFVLMLDDDVILQPTALETLLGALKPFHVRNEYFAYLQGTKWDCSNLRGYPDFQLNRVPIVEARNPNVPVERPPAGSINTLHFSCNWLDTGFALFDRLPIACKELEFQQTGTVANCGGEDALFALACRKADLPSYWVPYAEAVHLEKPGGTRFSDHAYRKDTVLQTAVQLGLNIENINEFLPGVKIHRKQDHE